MQTKKKNQTGVMTRLSIREGIQGVGMELLMKSEELIYATGSLTETQCEQLGSDIYLLAQVLGSILQQHGHNLEGFLFDLPESVGSVRVKNPYYTGGSEAPTDESAGATTGSRDEFPF